MGILGVQEVKTRRKNRWEVFIAAIIEKTLFVSPLFEILMEFGWQVSGSYMYVSRNWSVEFNVYSLFITKKMGI